MTEWPWGVLAERIRARRSDLRMSQRDLALASGTTERLIGALERAERDSYSSKTLRAVSRALGWTNDSIERILAGAEPTEPNGDPEPVDLVAEIQALREQMAKLTVLVEESISQRAGRR